MHYFCSLSDIFDKVWVKFRRFRGENIFDRLFNLVFIRQSEFRNFFSWAILAVSSFAMSRMRTSFLLTISGNFFHQMGTLQLPDVLLYIYSFIMFYEVQMNNIPTIVQRAQYYLSSMELRFWCLLTSVLKIVAFYCTLNLFLTATYSYYITIGSLSGNYLWLHVICRFSSNCKYRHKNWKYHQNSYLQQAALLQLWTEVSIIMIPYREMQWLGLVLYVRSRSKGCLRILFQYLNILG